MLELYKIIAFIKVYHNDRVWAHYVGLDTGKNNLEDYFCGKLKWSKNKLMKNIRLLKKADILINEPTTCPGITCFKMFPIKAESVKVYLEDSFFSLYPKY